MNVTPEQASQLIADNQDNDNFILLDVRTPAEYQEAHITHSQLCDFRSEEFDRSIQAMDHNKQYLLYCKSGGRSGNALEHMKVHGFKNISHIEGGILDWIAKGYPIT